MIIIKLLLLFPNFIKKLLTTLSMPNNRKQLLNSKLSNYLLILFEKKKLLPKINLINSK
jgi:hypothetical protein